MTAQTKSKSISACSCGCSEPHRAARRTLADGSRLELWSDGTICTAFGFFARGTPRPRTRAGVESALVAGWLVMGECELFDADDIEDLIAAARWVEKRGGTAGDVRDRFWFKRQRSLVPNPVWTSVSGGERWWVLNRMSKLSGIAVLDTRRGGRRRFRIMSRVARASADDTTYSATGFEFASVGEAIDHLAETVRINLA